MSPELSDRQRRILARLIAEYIDQGEPVSSSWLAEHSALGLSSATVRNILARLEEQGLVRQPHTSAGRVPTDSGYRLYVDWLLSGRKRRSAPGIEARLRRPGTVADLLEHASHEVSRASHQVGFALSAAGATSRLHHIDFVALDASRILIVVVATGGQLTHKVVDPGEPIDQLRLTQAANYINQEFAGLTVHEARAAILERMRQERQLYDALMSRALELARTGLAEAAPAETLHVQGTGFLIEELIGDALERDRALETLRALLRVIEEKSRLIELLTQYLDTPGLTVVIGSEHAQHDLQPFSLVASTFSDGDRTGVVGVIGPTRMRYERAITVVDGVSHAVSKIIETHAD
jgi:heat-inducible transcriptional repressor